MGKACYEHLKQQQKGRDEESHEQRQPYASSAHISIRYRVACGICTYRWHCRARGGSFYMLSNFRSYSCDQLVNGCGFRDSSRRLQQVYCLVLAKAERKSDLVNRYLQQSPKFLRELRLIEDKAACVGGGRLTPDHDDAFSGSKLAQQPLTPPFSS